MTHPPGTFNHTKPLGQASSPHRHPTRARPPLSPKTSHHHHHHKPPANPVAILAQSVIKLPKPPADQCPLCQLKKRPSPSRSISQDDAHTQLTTHKSQVANSAQLAAPSVTQPAAGGCRWAKLPQKQPMSGC
ncbi:hypothetical protein CCHR01_06970 [Colletotrichum chrysophilum]|uniref:Uncharacterized protein n=1 Tax=Colletotrichum chrysophilum TaxID=1836956 RepID=A0AAD9ALZ9_9PEZI|nr:hypothetical protein CCHR01_06970 [Colletotrichum chrysophilum]